MRTRQRHLALGGLLTVAMLPGCAGSSRAPQSTPATQSATAVAATCTGRPELPGAASWRLVTAEGFTFCVPPHWRADGSKGWRGDGSMVNWSVNSSPNRRVPYAVTGERPQESTSQETIDGVQVELRTIRTEFTHRIFADFRSPRIRLAGDARGAEGAETILQIYRSVRIDRARVHEEEGRQARPY